MTDYWRGYERGNSRHETGRMNSRSRNGRPPSGPWHPGIPLWEKKFCTSVCLIPWRKVCETQKMMQYCYQNIVEWDDSAGEEALKNAKERYWASINGLSCDLSLPDPDMYIDEVEWDCMIDPELIADLEWQPSVDVEDKDEKNDAWCHGWDDSRPVPCTGWGDEPESTVVDKNNNGGVVYDGWECSMNQPVVCTGWEGADGPVPPGKETADSGWENCDGNGTTTGWENKGWGGGGHDNRWDFGGCESRQGNGDSWENNCPNDWGRWESNPNMRNFDYHKNRGMPWGGTWNGNRRRRAGGGGGGRWNGFRQGSGSSTRFQADDRPINGGGGWNAKGRKRCSFIHENSNANINKRPLAPAQWHYMRSCGPVTHYGPAQSGTTWRSWEKQVS